MHTLQLFSVNQKQNFNNEKTFYAPHQYFNDFNFFL